MQNTFTEIRLPKRAVYVNEPWESEMMISEGLLELATGPWLLRSGDFLEINVINGSAKYQLLRRHENDIDA